MWVPMQPAQKRGLQPLGSGEPHVPGCSCVSFSQLSMMVRFCYGCYCVLLRQCIAQLCILKQGHAHPMRKVLYQLSAFAGKLRVSSTAAPSGRAEAGALLEDRPLASHPSEAAPLEASCSVQQQAPGDGHSTKGQRAPLNSHTSDDETLSCASQQLNLTFLNGQWAIAGSVQMMVTVEHQMERERELHDCAGRGKERLAQLQELLRELGALMLPQPLQPMPEQVPPSAASCGEGWAREHLAQLRSLQVQAADALAAREV